MAASWTIELSPAAARQLSVLPRNQQILIGRAIDRMQADPFQGDVQPLRGKQWQGRYRKRVGRHRLIFIPFHRAHLVEISAILLAPHREDVSLEPRRWTSQGWTSNARTNRSYENKE